MNASCKKKRRGINVFKCKRKEEIQSVSIPYGYEPFQELLFGIMYDEKEGKSFFCSFFLISC